MKKKTSRSRELSKSIAEAGERGAAVARSLWLAGLGLTGALVESTGGAVEVWIAKGKNAERAPIDSMRKATEALRVRIAERKDEVTGAFERGAAELLRRVGVPTRAEVQALRRRLDALQSEIRSAH